MTREQAKELLPVLQAYAEGKTVQIKNFGGDWMDCDFCVIGNEWRVKFEPQEYWLCDGKVFTTMQDAMGWKHGFKPSIGADVIHVREVIE